MRQLYPYASDDVDPLELYPADMREPPAERPWVLINMVAGADGACTVNGLSSALGSEADAAVFRAARASCDWILVAAGTARAERYGIPRPTADVAEARLAGGRSRAARLAVVTASGDLDAGLPMLADRREGETPPLIITGAAADEERLGAIGNRIELCRMPSQRITPEQAVGALHTRGARTVLCEGGPSWNAQMLEAELVDELCLTISPLLTAGDGLRIVAGEALTPARKLRLVRLLEHDGVLCARYLLR